MNKVRMRNWDKWQSYRRDRGQPPWIKVHREVMRNLEWVAMTDAQRGQLVAMWLLAADHDGVIPASPALIQKLCFMSDEPDLKFFQEQGFIASDANMTPSRRQADDEVSHQNRGRVETETETEGEETEDPPEKKPKKQKTGLPKDFCISDRVKSWAAEKGHGNLDAHLESFVGKVKANGYKYIDWDQAFMNAVRDNWAKLGSGKHAADSQMPDWTRGLQ